MKPGKFFLRPAKFLPVYVAHPEKFVIRLL